MNWVENEVRTLDLGDARLNVCGDAYKNERNAWERENGLIISD